MTCRLRINEILFFKAKSFFLLFFLRRRFFMSKAFFLCDNLEKGRCCKNAQY
jgi:hypothetical protein